MIYCASNIESQGTNIIFSAAQAGFALTAEAILFRQNKRKPSALTSGPCFAEVPSLRCRGGATLVGASLLAKTSVHSKIYCASNIAFASKLAPTPLDHTPNSPARQGSLSMLAGPSA
jgi:hypothetical protein